MDDMGNTAMTPNDRGLSKAIDKAGWGLILIWIGISVLANVGWGMGMLGMGVIVLGGQCVRVFYNQRRDWFGIIVGICFSLVGIKEILSVRFGDGNIVPILSIILGSAFLVAVLLQQKSGSAR